jgi:ribose/xylose/arabinose/galactoside ABC-type transport system permease subunit
MLCGMLAIGLQPQLDWFGSIILAVPAGASVGLVNGLLVVKARINSFILMLGTMTVVTGLMHLYSKGGSKAMIFVLQIGLRHHWFLSLLRLLSSH